MEDTLSQILQGYTDYVLTQKEKPTSVYVLCKHLEIDEVAFYTHFASIDAVEKALWLTFFTDTYIRITEDEVYAGYAVREKLLSFYYTWIEVLKPQRSYIVHTLENTDLLDFRPSYLQDMEKTFLDYAKQLMEEARETDEFPERMFVQNVYPQLLLMQARSVLKYWTKDHSANFEKSDVFIEKNINFVCDALSRSFLDSAFEYLKFVFER